MEGTGYINPQCFLRDERGMDVKAYSRSKLCAVAGTLALLFSLSVTAENRSFSTRLTVGHGNEEIILNLEIAACPGQRMRGLQGRTSLDDDAGMLFLIDPVDKVSMWMKDTFIPLDIMFVDANDRVVGLVESTTPQSLRNITSPEVVAAVVEVNAGFIRRSGIRLGDSVHYDLPEHDCGAIG